ncbi:membrane-anchored mycosin MYCP [Nocardioides ginsengisegetis]|uniref:Membrane-anchored mycosin MYCP n=1 Tax=Nocardioides ginsengisegetis TaxID=661491 RepID=A0A7W3J363_9ACTN|nr:membrane-anchored mycosin MYCP [Nocardioides ginsengisegetis]
MPVAPRIAAVAAAALAAVSVGAGSPAHAAPEAYSCMGLSDNTARVTDSSTSVPYELLGIDRAQQLLKAQGRSPGGGLSVAVVDSGISDSSGLVTVAGRSPWPHRDVTDPHGTAVAGLIAARARGDKPTGIAPGARLVDVRVYDGSDTGGADDIDTDDVVAGLDWVAQHASDYAIRVVNISLALTPTTDLERAVHHLVHDLDIAVVAASGNRPQDETDLLWSRFNSEDGTDTGPGEDAADAVYPAAYDDVIAVNATQGGPVDRSQPLSAAVLPNSQTDLAAPTFYGVSIGVNGSTCRIDQVATSWAAAEVSGVVALLRTAYPRDTVAQIRARLENTATGTPLDRTKFEGNGVVQPVEALTRPLHPRKDGTLPRATGEEQSNVRATAPRPQADVLASTRHHAVWWGLLGGGALLVALMLRPVLARRRD